MGVTPWESRNPLRFQSSSILNSAFSILPRPSRACRALFGSELAASPGRTGGYARGCLRAVLNAQQFSVELAADAVPAGFEGGEARTGASSHREMLNSEG